MAMAPINLEDTKQPVQSDMLQWNLWARQSPFKMIRSSLDATAFRRAAWPTAVYGGLALAVMLPMLTPGFILTLDMAFTPQLRLPEMVSSSYLFHAALHYLNLILPSEAIQKLLLLGILLGSGLGMHALVRFIQAAKLGTGEFAPAGAYLAGALYMINPFTYSRFMAGQYAVLLGYALLPFLARALLQFFAVPTLGRAVGLGVWVTIIGIVSLHTLGLAAIMALVSLGVCAWRWRRNRRMIGTAASYGLVSLAIFVVASGYWLAPLLTGASNQAQAAAGFGAGDAQAFATLGGDVIGQLGYVLQLQGFWAEIENMYLLPQEVLPIWPLAVLLLWSLIGAGLYWTVRHQRAIAAWFAGVGLAGTLVALFGLGNIAALAGFREPHKFIGLLALAFALFAGLGATALLRWASSRSNLLLQSLSVALCLLLVLLTPVMFWGFAGQLTPRQYPADWFVVNERLNQDPTNFNVLSLPWHLYMSYPFAGRVIVNPSEQFFDKPTITSNELEFKGASPTFPDAQKTELGKMLATAKAGTDLGRQLNQHNIKYVLLAKTYDYQTYDYLDKQTHLRLVLETANLKLYRNETYES